MKRATLSFLVKRSDVNLVLLGLKKRGFGCGKWNGFGGKLEPGEHVHEAAAREIEEECGLSVHPEHLEPAGHITFFFPSRPEFDHDVEVFVATAWQGDPHETDEMRPTWFPVCALPLHEMWRDDSFWLHHVLSGGFVEAEFTFAEDCETIARSSLRVRCPTTRRGR